MSEFKVGVYPSRDRLKVVEMGESRGLRSRDSVLIARSCGVGIWHSEKCASNEVPWWRPPFGDCHAIYRGFEREKLGAVLSTGLDVQPQAAFFPTRYADKAWEYPLGRDIATMLVLDESQAEKSYVTEPSGHSGTWMPDKTLYPHDYWHGTRQIHTRFDAGHRIPHFAYEDMYGYWVPGDARAALLGVVIGGPRAAVLQFLQAFQLSTGYGADLVQFEDGVAS